MNDNSDLHLLLQLVQQRHPSSDEIATKVKHGLIRDIAGAETQLLTVSVVLEPSLMIRINDHDLLEPDLHPELIASVRRSLLEWLNAAAPKQSPDIPGKKQVTTGLVISHSIFWLANGLWMIWLASIVFMDSSIVEFLGAFFANFWQELGLKSFSLFISSTLFILAPILGLNSYFSLLSKHLLTSKKIWQVLIGFELFQFLTSAVVISITSSNWNDGLVLLSIILGLVPLVVWAKVTLPATSLRHKPVLLAWFLWLSASVSITAYISLLTLFFIPLALAALVSYGVFSYFDSFGILYSIIWLLLYGGIFLGALAFPSVSFALLRKELVKTFPKVSALYARTGALSITATVAILLAVSVVLLSLPPSRNHFDQLNQYSNATTFEEKAMVAAELVDKEVEIEREIIKVGQARNAYPLHDGTAIGEAYEEYLNTPHDLAVVINAAFNVIAYPLVNHETRFGPGKSHQRSLADVNKDFNDLFGYLPGNRRDELGLSFSERPRVNLEKRSITAKNIANQQLVEVTIEEEYSNASPTDEEVIYEFTLPSSAVITDLKLGPQLEFQGQIAPRGAAAQVYQEQVLRMRDPALLEQVGPSQYRLRIYPIPGTRNEAAREPGNQRLSFTYLALITPQGIPLPWYSREENIATKVAGDPKPTLDGKSITYTDNGRYLATTAGYCTRFSGISTGTGEFLQPVSVVMPTLGNCVGGVWQPNLTGTGSGIALLVDVSARKDPELVRRALKKFFDDNSSIITSNSVTLFQFNTSLSAPVQLTDQNWREVIDSLVFFGMQNYETTLQVAPTNFDQVIVIGNGQSRSQKMMAPKTIAGGQVPVPPRFDFVFLDGSPPAMSLEATKIYLAHDVKIFDSIEEAIISQRFEQRMGETVLDIGPYWVYQRPSWNLALPTQVIGDLTQDSAEVRKIITSRLIAEWIAGLSVKQTEFSELQLLDFLHEAAKSVGIVTPYSSYIALVNAEQQQRLNQLSTGVERYEEAGLVNTGPVINPGVGWSSRSSGFSAPLSTSLNEAMVNDSLMLADGAAPVEAPENSRTVALAVAFLILILFLAIPVVWWIRHKKSIGQPK